MLFNRPFTLDRVMRLIISLIGITLALYLVTLLRSALLPFLIAWLLAYITHPFVSFFQYKCHFKSRIISIFASMLVFVLLGAVITVMVVPSISSEVTKTQELIRSNRKSGQKIRYIPKAWVDYIEKNVDMGEIIDTFTNEENLENVIKQVAPKLWSLVSNTFSVLLSITILFVIILYYIFISLDYESLSSWSNLIPQKHRKFAEALMADVEDAMNCYFRGQSLIALCVGILLAVGFNIINFPLATLLGLTIGFFNLIPYLQMIGIIPMVALSFLKSAQTGQNFWIIFGLSLLVLVIVQIIQDMILTPKIMGKAMGLNPAIMLLSLSVWGTLLGFIGLIIALPLTTLCISYYKRFVIGENQGKREENEKKGKKINEIFGG